MERRVSYGPVISKPLLLDIVVNYRGGGGGGGADAQPRGTPTPRGKTETSKQNAVHLSTSIHIPIALLQPTCLSVCPSAKFALYQFFKFVLFRLVWTLSCVLVWFCGFFPFSVDTSISLLVSLL